MTRLLVFIGCELLALTLAVLGVALQLQRIRCALQVLIETLGEL